MPIPVLLIHGIDDQYKAWGVEPVGGKGDSTFQNGLVKEYGYKSGSFPDILARSQNLSLKGEDINRNGIYFYQAPGEKIGGTWKEANPHWDSANSQSRYLYSKLAAVLDSFYGADVWPASNEYKIDLVAHSQGGLVIREMLRGLRRDKGIFGTDASNPANHIRKIVTVDSPHFGSVLASRNAGDIKIRFPGLLPIANDLDSRTPAKHTLLKKTEVGTLFERMSQGANEGLSTISNLICSNCSETSQALIDIALFPASLLGAGAGAIIGALTEVTVEITGSYLGPYHITTKTDKPLFLGDNTGSIALSGYRAQLWFRIPKEKSLALPSPDAWHTPESQASAKNAGGNVWLLDMSFDKHMLYSGDSVSEGNIGLHLTDWSTFDKTVCGIALKDKDGNVLFGKEPSVAECESYNGPNLLQPLYSLREGAIGSAQ